MTLPNIENFIFQCVAMALTALLIPRLTITSIFGPLLAVAGLALVNTLVWDWELFVAIPNAPTTKTASLLVMNGVVFWILVKLLPGIEVKGFLPALAAPLVFTIITVLITPYLSSVDWVKIYDTAMEHVDQLKGELKDSPDVESAPISPPITQS